jgi:ATP-dependent protease ClpP protease subunit
LALPPNPNPILIKPNPGKTLDRDFYMDAHQAAAWGIVDEVIDMRSDATFIKE